MRFKDNGFTKETEKELQIDMAAQVNETPPAAESLGEKKERRPEGADRTSRRNSRIQHQKGRYMESFENQERAILNQSWR